MRDGALIQRVRRAQWEGAYWRAAIN